MVKQLMSNYFVSGHRALSVGNGSKAVSMFKKFLKETPCKEGYLNLGNAYRLVEDEVSAVDCYLKAASGDIAFASGKYGDFDLALNNLGLVAYTAGKNEEAITFFKSALTVNPLFGEAIWNISCAKLKDTNCADGWVEHEYRFTRGESSVKIMRGLPIWNGVSSGNSITVQMEQGFGDKIQFARYIGYLRPFFKEIYVMCHPSLDIFFPGYPCVRALTGECTIPAVSLARIFGIVSPNMELEIEKVNRPGFNIACCWAGSPTHANDKYRSCPVGYMSSLSGLGNLFSISPSGIGGKNITGLRTSSWSETVSLLKGMQLVVSVDTSIVHLAGSLGIPCLMIQPRRCSDFRWGMPGDTNVWYDSVAIVDNAGTWDSTFNNVREIIKCLQ